MDFEESVERFGDAATKARKHLRNRKLKQAQSSISACEKHLKNMEREARHSDGVERKRLLEKIKKSKSTIQSMKQEYQQIAAGGASPSRGASNNQSAAKPSFNAMSDSNKTRARILENNNTLNDTDDLLADSQRIAAETREIGTAALNSIEDQTDMLIEAKESVDQTHLETKRAGALLNTMSRRVLTNKIFLVCVVLLLLGINILLIYFYHNKPSTSPPSPTPAAATSAATAALPVQQQDSVVLNQENVASLSSSVALAPKKSPLPVFASASVSAAALASTVASKNTGPLHVMKTIPLQHNSIKVGEPVHVESVEESKKAKDVMTESRKGAEEEQTRFLQRKSSNLRKKEAAARR